ncbi:hypothetical protein SLEP1_g30813 [Rubroshorea leprosula]|uniref:Uncharacterized protein n=1 Tax=Rubroshorea leprosula TaxID=152421 RepID=A0AAV5K762_9ROSI|nr:hypothetical protein SLEP1_g30813 [Rubroshorea leprosula]
MMARLTGKLKIAPGEYALVQMMWLAKCRAEMEC